MYGQYFIETIDFKYLAKPYEFDPDFCGAEEFKGAMHPPTNTNKILSQKLNHNIKISPVLIKKCNIKIFLRPFLGGKKNLSVANATHQLTPTHFGIKK